MWKPLPQRFCFGKKKKKKLSHDMTEERTLGDVWIDLIGFKRMAIPKEIHRLTRVESLVGYVNLPKIA